jgi:hypothetical protein
LAVTNYRGSAGVCGIVRTIELGGILSKNYTFDTINLIVWSAAELAVTMICIGIPTVALPLWRKVTGDTTSSTPKHTQPSDTFQMTNVVIKASSKPSDIWAR